MLDKKIIIIIVVVICVISTLLLGIGGSILLFTNNSSQSTEKKKPDIKEDSTNKKEDSTNKKEDSTNKKSEKPLSTISEPLNPVVQPTNSKWASVLNKGTDTVTEWSRKIYGKIVDSPNIGVDGGVTHNEGFIRDLSTLDKVTADKLCQNPCYWYDYRADSTPEKRAAINNSGLCDCKVEPNKAINF